MQPIDQTQAGYGYVDPIRAEAAEREAKQLKEPLCAVELVGLNTNQSSVVTRPDVEPAHKRLKRLKTRSNALQVQTMQTLVDVKQEKAELAEDLEDTQNDYQTQITFTDTLQTKLDEMKKLALANGATLPEVNKIIR